MTLTNAQQKKAAIEFSKRWAKEPGKEKQQAAPFWLELASDVLGIKRPTQTIFFEEQTNYHGFIDAKVPDAKTFIEQKSRGVDLDKKELRQGQQVTPFEQARNYANAQKNSDRPEWIIVSNFDVIRIYNLDVDYPEDNYISFRVDDLADNLHYLNFLVDPTAKRRQFEREVSWEAGELIGKLYSLLLQQFSNPDDEAVKHSLNVLAVRLVFCLYAEDAEIFPKNSFHDYLVGKDPNSVRRDLQILFRHLNTPAEKQDKYDEELKKFPYVNGGLFADDAEIPSFTQEIVDLLVDEVSGGTDWSRISPTIFGGVFESTLNPETRRKGGMHYTSPENIHRVIDPLFLDALEVELESIVTMAEGTRKEINARIRALEAFQDKIASLNFFDPACGSGNFLTETFMCLRRLENVVLTQLTRGQKSWDFEEFNVSPIKVSLNQFHGIEINDFACAVAETALWIAELQANQETEMIVVRNIEDLPLRDRAHIVKANALHHPWEDVLDPEECSYIIGNPPFTGKMTPELKADRALWFGKEAGRVDFVACWFLAAAKYMKGTTIETALVATNSICQGTQVDPIWTRLFHMGIHINFAHRSFRWTTEGRKGASVVVVIISFSYVERDRKLLWDYTGKNAELVEANHINQYLIDHEDMSVVSRGTPLDSVPTLVNGTKPAGKPLTFTVEDYQEVVRKYPEAKRYFRKYVGSTELTNATHRYVLWLKESDLPDIANIPPIVERLEMTREQRAESDQEQTFAMRKTPWKLFYIGDPAGEPFMVVPRVTSGARRYFPMGFFEDDTLPSDAVFFLPNADAYAYGVMTSRVHNTWLDVIGGKLKNDFRYSNRMVYNTFIWPKVTPTQRAEIAELAQEVLDAREMAFNNGQRTLDEVYKPGNEWAYPALFEAHRALDEAVERAYNLEPGCGEPEIITKLYALYDDELAREKLKKRSKKK
ncbi:class I SAM-dependent DNA methyltransferase [Corynebacterium sanguinis]|uniref:class I SAM-dependent DNA methyltransferase n=1 Tax=Corynebacterium sanguinis TaxID=2594913 RepID=UPI00223BDEB0|nr:DNA methyltransferase [Corynebacterium sanguinis]MCT1556220.1 class I SAM-dependent DNA methyltransferase [Corynebacterium sanguinis]MCT1598439.1 class I SAM-dependent DNA methyltransferase [Corynebacterium sanguinis]